MAGSPGALLMRFSLLTRAATRDYVFVGRRHVDRWWLRGDYQRIFSEELPGIAVRREGASWQILLAGIPTDRKDSHERRIRLSVLMESEGATASSDVDEALGLLQEWLDGLSTGDATNSQISKQLAHAFPKSTVETWFAGSDTSRAATDDKDLAQEVCDQLHTIASVARYDGLTVGVPFDRWFGGRSNADARRAFLVSIERMLREDTVSRGAAIVASLFNDRREFRDQFDKLTTLQNGLLAVLIDDAGEAEELRPKAPGSENPSAHINDNSKVPSRRPRLSLQFVALAFLVIGLLVITLLVLQRL